METSAPEELNVVVDTSETVEMETSAPEELNVVVDTSETVEVETVEIDMEDSVEEEKPDITDLADSSTPSSTAKREFSATKTDEPDDDASSSPKKVKLENEIIEDEGEPDLEMLGPVNPYASPDPSEESSEDLDFEYTDWTAADDVLLTAGVSHTCSIESVFQMTPFSRDFELEVLKERWYQLLYDEKVSSHSRKRIEELSEKEIHQIESKIPFSKNEEHTLIAFMKSKNASLQPKIGIEVNIHDFKECLNLHEKVFHHARTPQILSDHFRRIQKLMQKKTEAVDFARIESTDPNNDHYFDNFRPLRSFEARHNLANRSHSLDDRIEQKLPDNTKAVIRGTFLKYFMTENTVLLGRQTLTEKVDVDLSREGSACKVSRRQAVIEYKAKGNKFIIRNIGQRVMFIDAKPLAQEMETTLKHGSTIEVSTIQIFFYISHQAVLHPKVKAFIQSKATAGMKARQIPLCYPVNPSYSNSMNWRASGATPLGVKPLPVSHAPVPKKMPNPTQRPMKANLKMKASSYEAVQNIHDARRQKIQVSQQEAIRREKLMEEQKRQMTARRISEILSQKTAMEAKARNDMRAPRPVGAPASQVHVPQAAFMAKNVPLEDDEDEKIEIDIEVKDEEPTTSTFGVQQTMPLHPAIPVQPVMPVQSAMLDQPTMLVQPTMPLQPAMPDQPTMTVEPAMQVQPTMPDQPTTSVQPAFPVEPALQVHPAMPIQPPPMNEPKIEPLDLDIDVSEIPLPEGP